LECDIEVVLDYRDLLLPFGFEACILNCPSIAEEKHQVHQVALLDPKSTLEPYALAISQQQ
jgi:hypothetical protein